jgi:selenoprotein W-related protein
MNRNYEPRAAGLAAELKRSFKAETALIRGSGGVFDVAVDGRKVFSKHETGRFPEPGEVTRLLSASKE